MAFRMCSVLRPFFVTEQRFITSRKITVLYGILWLFQRLCCVYVEVTLERLELSLSAPEAEALYWLLESFARIS